MVSIQKEKVLGTHHWNERMFSFSTTRAPGLRFESGQFVTLGLKVDGRPLMRAYSMASASYDEHLEFLSIKVPEGPLTSRLQHLREGDEVLVSGKASGSLLISDLLPGKNLYLLCTGTGLAPFMSVIRSPDTYERFEKVILMHGVRYKSELAYYNLITEQLPTDEYLGAIIRDKLIYCPTVTREPFHRAGRITTLLSREECAIDLNLPVLNPLTDRAMICGSPSMLKDVSALLNARGFRVSPGIGQLADYVVERAFAEK